MVNTLIQRYQTKRFHEKLFITATGLFLSVTIFVTGDMMRLGVTPQKYLYISFQTVTHVGSKIALKFANHRAYQTQWGIHPKLLTKARCLLKKAEEEKIELRVISGFRSMDEQQRLYDQGRVTKGWIVTNARPGLSMHNYGFAFDVAPFKGNKPDWKSKHWSTIGKMGKECGLTWGGDWRSFVDKPHFQFSKLDIVKRTFENIL